MVYVDSACVAKYSITHGEYTIGRDPGAQVNLDVDGVSRHHARLTFQAYELVIEDLGSANGVFIEGVQISLPTRVRPDQQVEVGSARLFIRLKPEATAMLKASLWDPDLGLAPVRALLGDGKRYKVFGVIGGGGMGLVHEARDLHIRRRVAMKVVKSASQFSRENVLRFVEEAQLTGQLQHPNIVPVYELALDEQGEVFYTMKYVKGTTLQAILRAIRKGNEEIAKKYPLAALLAIFQKICDAMAYAHSMGVVHRDLKPDNVMIGEYGEVLVMDWGLAKKVAQAGGEDPPAGAQEMPASDLRGFQTLSGLIVGTPPYIPPEAARGEIAGIDPRSDIYVLGAILYAILTLRPPYPGKEFGELIEQIVAGMFPHPASFNAPAKGSRIAPAEPVDGRAIVLAHLPGRRVPDGLAAVVMKAMNSEPAGRYQTVEELQEDVTAWQSGFAPKAERAGVRRQFILWAGRHKTNVALIGVFVILFHTAVILFFLSLKHERDGARASRDRLAQAMGDLMGAAPLFADEARDLVRKRDFDLALDRIESALRQVPNEAEYHNLRGNILQSLLRWDDAVEAYQAALGRNREIASARENIELTERLIASMGENQEIGQAELREMQKAFQNQGRLAEAVALGEKLGNERPIAIRAIRQMLESDPKYAPLRELFTRREFRGRFTSNADGSFSANFRGLPYPAILLFFSVPPEFITGLVLDETKIPDLKILEGMKLRQLSIAGCVEVSDLSPLRGMPLERLNLARTSVQDLTPLAGMPLRELNLEECRRLRDLRALTGCTKLERLLLPGHLREISYLRGLKSLKFISYKNLTQSAEDFWNEFDARK